jgi:hypothetical protein
MDDEKAVTHKSYGFRRSKGLGFTPILLFFVHAPYGQVSAGPAFLNES